MTLLLPDLLPTCAAALATLRGLQAAARQSVAGLVSRDGRIDRDRLEAEPTATHGYARLATSVEALARMLDWAGRLEAAGRLGELEGLMLQAAFGEYIGRIHGGIAMGAGGFVRPADLGLDAAMCHKHHSDETSLLRRAGNTAGVRLRIAELLGDGGAVADRPAAGGDSPRLREAAQALALAQDALEAGLRQVARPVAASPRVAGMLAWMAVETMAAHQLTRAAGDDGAAAMAALLATQVAWANADTLSRLTGDDDGAAAVARLLLAGDGEA